MPTILVTNDDGVFSPGLLALKQALTQIADVIVLAPERNWSASSHIKTMHKPLRIQKTTLADGSTAFSSSGSPTDCVALAMGGALEVVPDLVVAGVNAGYNLGIDVTYSGTVACAMEAVIKGVPGIAVSTSYFGEESANAAEVRRASAEIACMVTQQIMHSGLPEYTLLNVNVPPAPSEGIRLTRMGRRHYDANEVERRHDPYGRPYYWLGGSHPIDEEDPDTDVGAIRHGFVSVTPISLDLTHHSFLAAMREQRLPFAMAGVEVR
ncbi:MAG: 5'-nucleotidase SurE [Chloroflexota bacterium]|nr:5'/3'-nucleotidase SurE [Caldilinea sp.]GIK73938.1 MAG: 5'-nucleotidase SurE [Chloroflexota bacterium]